MKIIFKDKFTLRQMEIIRVAAIVAAGNFPMPGTVEIYRMPPDEAKINDGAAFPRKVYLRAGIYGAALFKTASHEFCHVSQYHCGELVADHEHFYWYGKKIPARMRYHNQPHEREAFSYEDRLIPREEERT